MSILPEAATLPLAALTAAASLYGHLQFPAPWTPTETPTPFIIYGASTAVGSFAIKFARNSNIHPIIAIAGKGASYVQGLLDPSKGDAVVDYRQGVQASIQAIKDSLKKSGQPTARHALDTIASEDSAEVVRKSLVEGGKVDFVLPNELDVSPAVKTITNVGSVHNQPGFATHDNFEDLGLVFSRYLTRALKNGTFTAHPFEVRPGGLEGVDDALKDLKAGKASAVKYVFRIADTPGLA